MIGRKTSRALASLASGVTIVLVTSACGADPGAGDEDIVVVGQLAHITGSSAAPYGIPFDRGLKFGIEVVNESGALGDIKIELKSQDVAGEIPAAVTGFNQFVRDGVDILASPNSTPVELALTPLVNEEEAFLVTGATGEDKADNVFALPDVVTPHMRFAREMVQQGNKRIVVVVDGDNPAFDTIAKNFEKGVAEAGGDLAERVTISAGDSDFSPVITKLKREAPDLIFLSTLSETAGNMMTQMKRSGGFDKTQLAGSVAWQQQVYETAGDAAVGALFPTYWAPGAAESKDFETSFKKTFGKTPVPYDALGYQAAWVIASTIKMAKEKGEEVNGAALTKYAFDAAKSPLLQKHGVVSGFEFTRTGLAQYPGVFVTFSKDGSITPIGR